ncbi:MAG: PAS domain S-box protein [Bacteroidales bacterium]|nr:PAS domain S-box protein [Bacteroidales bacterium]
MTSHRQKPLIPWLLIALFVIVSAVSIILGYLYYRSQKARLLNDNKLDLSAIADLKVRQIAQWRNERLSDAFLIGENTAFLDQLKVFLANPGDLVTGKKIVESFSSILKHTEYRNIQLIDSTGKLILHFPSRDSMMAEQLKISFPQLIRLDAPALTDLYKQNSVSRPFLELIIPLRYVRHNNSLASGILAIRIDPDQVLYPLIHSWPVPSKTAESLLVREENDEVVYLNDLRFRKNSGLVLRMKITGENLPAAMAVRGIEETTEGIDYRGSSVVAVMKKVPGSSWYMVAKVDHNEVFTALDRQMTMIIIIIILFILTIGLLLGIIEWNENARFYRGKYEAELDHLALRKHFDYILKYANDIIFLADSDLVVIEANDRALEAYQLRREELIGTNLSKLVSPGNMTAVEEEKKILEEKGFSTFETCHMQKDGNLIPVEISARKVEIEGVKYFQYICRDITERKQSESILRESEERFRKIFEESPFGIVMTGKDLGIIRANNAFCNMLGYKEEDLKTLTLRDFTYSKYISGDEIAIMKLISGEIPVYHSEKQYIRIDGTKIWGSTTVSIIRNNHDEIQYFLALVEDITLRKQTETELEKSFSLLKATLESTADGILVVDSNGKIVQYNQKFSEMWRIPDNILESLDDETAVKYVMEQLIDPEEFKSQVKQLYTDPEITTSDLLEFKDGRVFERYSQPQRISGKCVGRVWSFRDITESKRAEAELVAAKEKAEENDRLKTAFLHNVSHEIRMPMNAIIGFTALLNEPDTTGDEKNQFIDIIFQSGSQLLSIINDIVDIANIESGLAKLNLKDMDLNSSLRSLNEQFSYKEKTNVISIILHVGLPDDKAMIVTDSTKLIQILSNLINNATKFTREGQIDFGYRLKDNNLEFYVKDTGIGIPPELHEKIFERFFQVDNLVSRKFGGTGLGLSICKAYVELLGGKIWVQSSPGEGTTFKFTIPYKKQS